MSSLLDKGREFIGRAFSRIRRKRVSPSTAIEILAAEGRFDAQILRTAMKYGGVITKSIIVYEFKEPLDIAEKILNRFCKHGVAIKKRVNSLILYDFPGARTYLANADIKVVEILRDHYPSMSRVALLQATGFPIEALEESIKRLESRGIVSYDEISDEHKLRCISPP